MSAYPITHELIFTPMLLTDLMSKFQDKLIDTQDKLIVKSIYKLFEIFYSESLEVNKIMSKARTEFSIEQIRTLDIEQLYDYLET